MSQENRSRILKWAPGPACNGTVYFMQAWHNDIQYLLTKVFVRGVERYEIWRNKVFMDIFNDRVKALQYAEGLL